MRRIVTGIDDFGTELGSVRGWTFFSFERQHLTGFMADAKIILNRSKLSSFHGKNFKRKRKSEYLDFLLLVKETLLKSDNRFLASILLDNNSLVSRKEIIDEHFLPGLNDLGAMNDNIISASTKIALPIDSYFRLVEDRMKETKCMFHIDYHKALRGLQGVELMYKGVALSNQLPIVSMLNKFREMVYPKAPEIERYELQVLPDEVSFLIQAADIFGNFLSSVVFSELHRKTNTNTLKREIFSKVFGDLVDSSQIPNYVALQGNEFTLNLPGSFVLKIS